MINKRLLWKLLLIIIGLSLAHTHHLNNKKHIIIIEQPKPEPEFNASDWIIY
jgi:hypothetical protein